MIEHFYTKIGGWFTFPNLYKSISGLTLNTQEVCWWIEII